MKFQLPILLSLNRVFDYIFKKKTKLKKRLLLNSYYRLMKIFAYKTENILNVCFITWSKNN